MPSFILAILASPRSCETQSWFESALALAAARRARSSAVRVAIPLSWAKAIWESAKLGRLVAVLGAIGASQAMTEFETDGTIITANENFLGSSGVAKAPPSAAYGRPPRRSRRLDQYQLQAVVGERGISDQLTIKLAVPSPSANPPSGGHQESTMPTSSREDFVNGLLSAVNTTVGWTKRRINAVRSRIRA